MGEAIAGVFQEVCDALAMVGLSHVICASVVTHACKTLGLVPSQLRRTDVPRLAPILERSLRTFLGEQQLAEGLRRLNALAVIQARPTTRETLAAVSSFRRDDSKS